MWEGGWGAQNVAHKLWWSALSKFIQVWELRAVGGASLELPALGWGWEQLPGRRGGKHILQSCCSSPCV